MIYSQRRLFTSLTEIINLYLEISLHNSDSLVIRHTDSGVAIEVSYCNGR